MTMPYGSAEEPELELVGQESIPVRVVSTDAKPGKQIGTEFGRFRTIIVSNVIGSTSSTPGAQRLVNRSLRRKRAHIIVNGTQPTSSSSQNEGSQTSPSAGTTIVQLVLGAGLWQLNWTVELAGTVGAADANNFGLTANGVNLTSLNAGAVGTYGQSSVETLTAALGIQTVAIKAIALATVGAVYSAQITAIPLSQAPTDGILVGSREEINSGMPAIPGQLGGYLQIGDNLRYEAQPELWVCYPATNIGPVYVTVCDEVYASDPSSYKEQR